MQEQYDSDENFQTEITNPEILKYIRSFVKIQSKQKEVKISKHETWVTTEYSFINKDEQKEVKDIENVLKKNGLKCLWILPSDKVPKKLKLGRAKIFVHIDGSITDIRFG